MDDRDFNNFIAGFVSGEGCFYVSIFNKSTGHIQVQCGFSIKVRNDDRELIKAIHRVLKYSGNIYEIESKRYRYAWDSIKRHDAVLLLIRNVDELVHYVIPFFDQYPPRGRKRRNYDLWKEAVAVLASGDQGTAEGLEKIQALQAQLNQYQPDGAAAQPPV